MVSTFEQIQQQYVLVTPKQRNAPKLPIATTSKPAKPFTENTLPKSDNVVAVEKSIEFLSFGKSKDSLDKAETNAMSSTAGPSNTASQGNTSTKNKGIKMKKKSEILKSGAGIDETDRRKEEIVEKEDLNMATVTTKKNTGDLDELKDSDDPDDPKDPLNDDEQSNPKHTKTNKREETFYLKHETHDNFSGHPNAPVESELSTKPSDTDEKETLSLEEKVKRLQENFESTSPPMTKKLLQQDDVNEDLHAASSCLKAMSSTDDPSKRNGVGTEESKFVDKNLSETFYVDKGVRRYVMGYEKKELNKIETDLKQYSVDIKANKTGDSFLISGTKIGIDRSRNALRLLTSSVTMNELKVQQPGLHKFFTNGRGDMLVKSIEHEHHCAIEKKENASQKTKLAPRKGLRDSDETLDKTSSSESDDEDESDSEHLSSIVSTNTSRMTCGNITISWKKGNIVTEQADILVGSAIGKLLESFKAAGGPQMQKNLKELGGKILSGGVTLIKTGKLACNQVILKNCCKWDSGNGAAEKELRSIVQKCLQQALQLKATSIAFPIIGTGGLGFPNNIASQILISEAINVISGWGTSSLNDIRFIVFDQDAQLINAFQQEFISAASAGQTGTHGHNIGNIKHNMIGNVSVHVVHGDLVKEQGRDAIININSTDMNMQKAGILSKAIAAAAGKAVQDECTGLGQQTPGSAVVTGAGNLNVQHIIHMIPGKADVQHIQSCIEKCLQVADKRMYKTISMPAFGTGNYGMSEADSAKAIFQALANVCPNLHNVKQIRIVIFQAQMVSTFQQTQQQYGARTPKHSSSSKLTPGKPAKPSDTSKLPKSETSIAVEKAIEFRLFGKSKDSVDKAENALSKGLKELCKIQKVENKDVSKLSERQREQLTTKASELDVAIKFEDRIQRIVVQGDAEDVSVIIIDIWKEIHEGSQKEKDNEHAKVLYKTVKWQYELQGISHFFNESSNAVIEKAHANKDTQVTVEVNGEKYLVVFAQSTGTSSSTGKTISVTRTTVGSAAGHNEGIALPKEWCPMPSDSSGKEKTVHLVSLTNGSVEYQTVLNMFQSTGGIGRIIKIERIQNPHLYQQYMVRKLKMDKDNRGMNNERQLFHGTAEKNLNDINAKGFNRSFSGINGTDFGNGVYFAINASYSIRYATPGTNNNKHMYLARVLTGQHSKGCKGLKVPPKDPTKPDISFDSATGYDGSIFVVFYDSQCYPEYLITFQ